MRAKENRLKKKKDFALVFKKGQGVKEDLLVLKFLPNQLKNSRLGIIVSQKVSKKATSRNKIKRRLKNLIQIKMPNIKKKVDIVIITLPGLGKKDFWETEKIVNKLFQKAKLI